MKDKKIFKKDLLKIFLLTLFVVICFAALYYLNQTQGLLDELSKILL